MPRRDRRDDDDHYIAQPAPRPAPQAHVACGCNCPTCNSGHCHNMASGCNVR